MGLGMVGEAGAMALRLLLYPKVCDVTLKETSERMYQGLPVPLSTQTQMLMDLVPEVAVSIMRSFGSSLLDFLSDAFIQQPANFIINQVQSALRVGMEYLTGLCGLVPEVGGIICMVFTGALTAAEEWLGGPLASFLTNLMKDIGAKILDAIAWFTNLVAQDLQNAVNSIPTLISELLASFAGEHQWLNVILQGPIMEPLVKVLHGSLQGFSGI